MKLWNGASWIAGNGFLVDDTTGDFALPKTLTVTALIANGTGGASYIKIPSDTTGNRPSSASAGMIRFNSSLNLYEGFDGTDWRQFLSGGSGGVFEDLTASGDIVLGDSCVDDTLTISAVTTVNCNMIIGTNNTTTVGFGSLIGSDIIPNLDVIRNLGSPGARWANIYTGDLHLANDRGDWTVIEEETYLSLRDNKTGKTFKIIMEEV